MVSVPADGGIGHSVEVVVVDPTSGSVTATIPLPGSSTWDPGSSVIAVDSSTHAIYVTGYDTSAAQNQGGLLTFIDGTSNTITGTLTQTTSTVPLPVFLNYIAVDSSSHHVFVSGEALVTGQSVVVAIDGTAKTAITKILLDGNGSAAGLAVDSASHTVWAVDSVHESDGGTSSLLTVIDGTANTAGTQTPYAGKPSYLADDPASTGQVFLVTQNPQVVVLDGPTTFAPSANHLVNFVEACHVDVGSYRAEEQDSTGAAFTQAFDSSGNPTGSPAMLAGATNAALVSLSITQLNFYLFLATTDASGSPAFAAFLYSMPGC